MQDNLETYRIIPYNKNEYTKLIQFLQICLPESGRHLDLEGHHKLYQDIEHTYDYFWCMYDQEHIIGVVAIRGLGKGNCELKSLYLLQKYQGKGLGYQLIRTAIQKAEDLRYERMYLDTFSTSKKAISLYEKVGFVRIERYNDNNMADVFMCMSIVSG